MVERSLIKLKSTCFIHCYSRARDCCSKQRRCTTTHQVALRRHRCSRFTICLSRVVPPIARSPPEQGVRLQFQADGWPDRSRRTERIPQELVSTTYFQGNLKMNSCFGLLWVCYLLLRTHLAWPAGLSCPHALWNNNGWNTRRSRGEASAW